MNVEAGLVAVVEVRVDHGRAEVVRGSDGVHVAGEVEVEQLHRDDLTTGQFTAILATLELLAGKRGAEFEKQQVASLSQMVTEAGAISEVVRPFALRMLATAVIRDRQKDLPPALQQQ